LGLPSCCLDGDVRNGLDAMDSSTGTSMMKNGALAY
jgi:hypothetical protein